MLNENARMICKNPQNKIGNTLQQFHRQGRFLIDMEKYEDDNKRNICKKSPLLMENFLCIYEMSYL